MKNLVRLLLSAASFAVLLPLPARGEDPPEADRYWPQWRGPRSTGEAPLADPPSEWSEAKNVKWKVAVPGKGHASPVVWGERVFVLSAVPTDKRAEPGPGDDDPGPHGRKGPPSVKADTVLQYTAFAYSRKDGKLLWRKALREELPHERTHVDGSWATGSPATDGRSVWAFFGSRGLHCLTVDGEIRWQKDFGKMSVKMQFGEGSSPVLHGDRILVLWDHEGTSFLAALDKETGKELWRTERAEKTSWSTPLVVEVGGKPQVIASATQRVRSYDLGTGALLWECAGMTQNVIPSPVAAGGMVFLSSGFRGNALLAVRLDGAKGDLTGTGAVVWTMDRNAPYSPSPLLVHGRLYFLKGNDAVLSCVEAATGKEHFAERKLEGLKGDYASPVAAAGRVIVLARNGAAAVLKEGAEGAALSVNVLEDEFTASPALAGKDLVLRGHRFLYCIGGE